MGADRQAAHVSGRAASDTTSIVKRFDTPEQVLVFEKGRLEVITVGGRAIGKGSYLPGWKWSYCAAPTAMRSELPDHVGVVLTGRAKVLMHEGGEIELLPGDFFRITAEDDEWVVGYRPCEILYLSGVEALIKELHRPE
jgi:hypothetical protein